MIEITPLQARVIGALIEKEVTTPDQYPLSLNALVLACNQKVTVIRWLELSAEDVQAVVDELVKKNLVAEVLFGSRVPKFKHRFCNTEFSQLHFEPKSLAILCVMFLRGPQTPGELRSRTARLCQFRDAEEVDETLAKLASAAPSAFVEKLAREPGKRESRYRHLFFSESDQVEVSAAGVESASSSASVVAVKGGEPLSERVAILERELSDLRAELLQLRQAWDDFNA